MKSSASPPAIGAARTSGWAQPVSFDPTAAVDGLDRTLLTVRVGQRSRDVVAECGCHRATPEPLGIRQD